MQALSALKIIGSLPPVGNIQTSPFYRFNPYLFSLRSCLSANSHYHTYVLNIGVNIATYDTVTVLTS